MNEVDAREIDLKYKATCSCFRESVGLVSVFLTISTVPFVICSFFSEEN